jgi:predicted nucleic acid-binding protein
MKAPVVLDADGLSAIAEASPPNRLRAILDEAYRDHREVVVPAVVCAEVCRGIDRTRAVEAAISRAGRAHGRAPVEVVDTTFDVARRVGAILSGAGAGTEDLVDAHVVAACVPYGAGLVVTSDPDDIARLAAVLPGTRIVTRPAR